MTPLSDVYAAQKTPVSGQRATYWATKAAEAGDPQGWLVLGFEYDNGKLGGDPPYWHRMAMGAYKKSAKGGNCMAMMEIGDLYASGSGVPADNAQAQSWHAQAQSCVNGNIELLQQQAAQYRARAAAARDPMLSAILTMPKLPPTSDGNVSRTRPRAASRNGFSFSPAKRIWLSSWEQSLRLSSRSTYCSPIIPELRSAPTPAADPPPTHQFLPHLLRPAVPPTNHSRRTTPTEALPSPWEISSAPT